MTVTDTNLSHYQPFYHEIVEVVDHIKAEDQRIQIHSERYPMIKFGDLLFSRAGVNIYAHPTIDKALAQASCLYFSNQREHRECQDLSHGWGHNSRWRTNFIRNYDTDKFWRINVDASVDLNDAKACAENIRDFDYPFDFTLDQAKELLLNRHFIYTNHIPRELLNDFFPYDWRLDVAKDMPI